MSLKSFLFPSKEGNTSFSTLFTLIALSLSFVYVVYASYHLYKSTLFFEWDEWSFLANLTANDSFTWLFQVHLGHFQPFGRLIYLIEIYMFGDNYSLYVVTNYVVHFINTMLFFFVLRKFGAKSYVAAGAALIFAVHAAHMENLTWGMQIMLLTATTSIIVALLGVVQYIKTKKIAWLAITIIASAFGAFTFEFALPISIFCLVFIAISVGGKEVFKSSFLFVLLTLFVTQCILALLWLQGSNLDMGVYVHPNATNSPNLELSFSIIVDTVKFILIGVPNSIIFALTGFKLGLDPIGMVLSAVILFFIAFYCYKALVSKPNQKAPLVTAFFMLVVMLGMVAVSRLELPMIYQTRYYVFFMVPALIIVCVLFSSFASIPKKFVAAFLIFCSVTLVFPQVGSRFAPLFVQIEPTFKILNEWWKYDKGQEIRESWGSAEERSGSVLWLPKANPELTVAQKVEIRKLLNSD